MRLTRSLLVAALATLAAASSANARSFFRNVSGKHAVSAHVRYYGDHESFTNRPFMSDDIGFGLAYEFHDNAGFWQVGFIYCDKPGGIDDGYSVTPFINLLLKDRYVVGGIGILKPYLSDDGTGDSEWEDLYFNWILGLDIPVGTRFGVQLNGYYDFSKWSELRDFEFGAIEFAVGVSLKF